MTCVPALAADGPVVAQNTARFENLAFAVTDLRPDDGMDAVAGFQILPATDATSSYVNATFVSQPGIWQNEMQSYRTDIFGKGLIQPLANIGVVADSEARAVVLSNVLYASTATETLNLPPAGNPADVQQVGSLVSDLLYFQLAPYSSVTFSATLQTNSELDLSTIASLQSALIGANHVWGQTSMRASMSATMEGLNEDIHASRDSVKGQLLSQDGLGQVVSQGDQENGLITLTLTNNSAQAAGGNLSLRMLSSNTIVTNTTVVPEPATYALMALGLAGVGAMSRRASRGAKRA